MSLYLDGVALITGAGHGIGRECALGYAAEGVKGILLADLNYASALDAAQESEVLAINPSFVAVAVQIDVADPASVAEMITTLLRTFGGVDYYVNGTGVKQPDQEWHDHAMGKLHVMYAVVEVMKSQDGQEYKVRGRVRDSGRGTIITIGPSSASAHAVSAEELRDMIRKTALHNAPHGIRVNAICPGWVEDVDPLLDGDVDPSVVKSAVPMMRPAKAEEIADVVLFMSSPRATYVTGVVWTVDGGMAIQGDDKAAQ